jgi:protease I
MKKVLMLVGDFVEDYESMVPYQALLMLGAAVHVVSPGKLPGQSVITAVHDFVEGYQSYVETLGHRFAVTHDFETIDWRDYDALVIPGGRAAEYLRINPKVVALVQGMNGAGKVISAICHGVQLLTATGVVEGRRTTAYPACRPELEQAKGIWVDTPMDGVCVDGNLVTSPAWPSHPAFLNALRKLLSL